MDVMTQASSITVDSSQTVAVVPSTGRLYILSINKYLLKCKYSIYHHVELKMSHYKFMKIAIETCK